MPIRINSGGGNEANNSIIPVIGDYSNEIFEFGLCNPFISTKLPAEFKYGSAVIYHGELHTFGMLNVGSLTSHQEHYKFDGLKWIRVSSIPVYNGTHDITSLYTTIVYQDKIHLWGVNKHYTWDEKSGWIQSGGPASFAHSVGILDNKLYLVYCTGGGGYSNTAIYDGESWKNLSATIPFRFSHNDTMVVFNNKIHFLNGTYHYVYNSVTDEWVELSSLPTSFFNYGPQAVVYNNQIHIFGTDTQNRVYTHYVYNSDTDKWNLLTNLPYSFEHGYSFVYKNKIIVLGGSGTPTKIKVFDGTTWMETETPMPNKYTARNYLYLVEFKKELYILTTPGNTNTIFSFKKFVNDTGYWKDVPLPDTYKGGIVSLFVYKDELYLTQSITYSVFDGETWKSANSPGSGGSNQYFFIHNDELHLINGTSHYKTTDVKTWTKLSNSPFNVTSSPKFNSIIFENKTYIHNAGIFYELLDDNTWMRISLVLPFTYSECANMCVIGNCIYAIQVENDKPRIWKFTGLSWSKIFTASINASNTYAGGINYNNFIILSGFNFIEQVILEPKIIKIFENSKFEIFTNYHIIDEQDKFKTLISSGKTGYLTILDENKKVIFLYYEPGNFAYCIKGTKINGKLIEETGVQKCEIKLPLLIEQA